MKEKGFEQLHVILLFILVLLLFSLAERDSKKHDRPYKTAQSIQQKEPSRTIQIPSVPATKATT